MATHSSVLDWRIPMDRGAWWATVHGVAQSWTQLKQLSMQETNSVIPLKKQKPTHKKILSVKL